MTEHSSSHLKCGGVFFRKVLTNIKYCAAADIVTNPISAANLLVRGIRRRKEVGSMNIAGVKSILVEQIMNLNPSLDTICQNPNKDFSRKRKLSFDQVITVILSMKGGPLTNELLDFFECSPDCITSSGFCQQRDKILPEAFYLLFKRFLNTYANKANLKTYKGFRMFAVDGSDVQITPDENDKGTFYPGTNGQRPYALIHLNAFYDLENRIYEDALIQKRNDCDEGQALINMMEKSSISKALIIADRGYESYNTMAHIEEYGWYYLIRIRNSAGIAKGLELPNTDELDMDISMNMTRTLSDEIKRLCEDNCNKYRYVPKNSRFDYLPLLNKKHSEFPFFYTLNYRIVRFKISDTVTETIVTNLPRDTFSIEEIKKIYASRWSIETSFRDLKYTMGMLHFHSKKMVGILQEIYASLIMYNFTELITSLVLIKSGKRKYVYKANFSIAVHMSRVFLQKEIPPPNIEAIIAKNLVPIRPDREYTRKQSRNNRIAICFTYRVA